MPAYILYINMCCTQFCCAAASLPTYATPNTQRSILRARASSRQLKHARARKKDKYYRDHLCFVPISMGSASRACICIHISAARVFAFGGVVYIYREQSVWRHAHVSSVCRPTGEPEPAPGHREPSVTRPRKIKQYCNYFHYMRTAVVMLLLRLLLPLHVAGAAARTARSLPDHDFDGHNTRRRQQQPPLGCGSRRSQFEYSTQETRGGHPLRGKIQSERAGARSRKLGH